MELRIYLRKFNFIENQTFIRKFYTTKILSYAVFDSPTILYAYGIMDTLLLLQLYLAKWK